MQFYYSTGSRDQCYAYASSSALEKHKNFHVQRTLPKNGLKSIILKYIFSLKLLAWKQTLKYNLQSQDNFWHPHLLTQFMLYNISSLAIDYASP